MVEEGRLDQEEVDRLFGSADDLAPEEVAAVLEEALRARLPVVTFDPIEEGFRIRANWGTGETEGRLIGASTLYIKIEDRALDEEAIWSIWDGEVWVSMPFTQGSNWLLRDASIVHHKNNRWIKAMTR